MEKEFSNHWMINIIRILVNLWISIQSSSVFLGLCVLLGHSSHDIDRFCISCVCILSVDWCCNNMVECKAVLHKDNQ